MQIKDLHIFFKTEGKQLTFVLLFGVWSTILYFFADTFEKLGCVDSIFSGIIKGVAIFLAVYYLAYCIILTKRIVDRHFK